MADIHYLEDPVFALPENKTVFSEKGWNGVSVFSVADTGENFFVRYREKLLKNGFSLYDENVVRDNAFATLRRDGLSVQLYYTENDHRTHIIIDPVSPPLPIASGRDAALPDTADLYQFELDYRPVNCGMCYIIKAQDGTYFLIDSAHFAAENEYRRIHDFLRKLTPAGEKIVIRGWFFSHAHQDHICQFMSFLRADFPDTEIQGLYYNFPDLEAPGSEHWGADDKRTMEEFRELTAAHPEIPNYLLHTGQKFSLSNLDFEVILTHEDMYPEHIRRYNDSSAVLLMTVNGCRVVFLGDSNIAESYMAVARYGAALKSDIVQVAHHGYNAANVGIYYCIEPRVALYPCPVKNYKDNLMFESNRVIRRLADEIYLSQLGTVKLPLPYKAKSALVLPKEIPGGVLIKNQIRRKEGMLNRIFKDGDTVLFTGDSITDTHRDKATNIDLGQGYPPKVKAIYDSLFPDNKVNFVNRGVSGDTTKQMLGRYEENLKAVKPDFISILIGINDVWRHISNVCPTSPELLEESYRSFLENIKRDFPNTPIMIIEPYLLMSDPEKESWLSLFNANLLTIRKLAREFADYYVPLQGIFDKYIAEGMTDMELSEDGVHPTDKGHGIIAYEYLKALGVI